MYIERSPLFLWCTCCDPFNYQRQLIRCQLGEMRLITTLFLHQQAALRVARDDRWTAGARLSVRLHRWSDPILAVLHLPHDIHCIWPGKAGRSYPGKSVDHHQVLGMGVGWGGSWESSTSRSFGASNPAYSQALPWQALFEQNEVLLVPPGSSVV